ncbi:MAG: DUF1553 domain-containing protein [Acidobacteria bacterium]|nr:DUF1553 domain-containing protein [Acidobacteriota bacterium]
MPSRYACLLVLSASLAAQVPAGHPTVRPGEDRLQKLSALTQGVRGGAVQAAPVARRNFIDEHIFSRMEKDKIPHAPLSTDEEFFRRLHLDLTGRIGDSGELAKFLADADPLKRDKLIDAITTTAAFKSRWTYWFGDLAKSAANRVGNEGKNLFYKWIYDNVHLNRPYNEMVKDMLTANAASNWYVGPASYVARWVVIGLACEDTVHEDTSDELAINSVKHFLGVDLSCVSCHDGANHLEKINLYLASRKREELWKTAAFFGGTRVLRRVEVATTRDEYSIDDEGPGYDSSARTVVRVPRNGKGKVEPAFFLNAATPNPQRPLRSEYAKILTGHPQFARASVNRFWAEMMGVGIVDPPEEFDLFRQDPANPPPAPWTLQPSHPELLNALAEDFVKHNYDLRYLLRTIAKSSAYQLSSRFPGEWRDSYAKFYARKFVRRLTAEQVHDSLVFATNLQTQIPIRDTNIRVRFATELRSPEDLKQPFPGAKDIAFFLDSFGQTNREYSERTNDGDVTQAVLLLNSPFVRGQIKSVPGSYLATLKADKIPQEQIVDKLFWRFLQRAPTPDEKRMALQLNNDEDLQWLLVNKVEFLFNY